MIGNLAAPLTTGMPIVKSYRFDANVALELIERDGATFTVASITVFIALMNANTAGERDLSAFHKIVSGGAPIAAATIEAYEQTFGSYIHTAPRRRLRVAGRDAQHAFWGPEPPARSMLAQLAIVSRTPVASPPRGH